MADVFTPAKRSKVMSAIRSAGTQPERRLYAAIRSSLGHRWRIDRNVGELPGKPDVVVPSLRLALFADGCFFHHCPVHGRIPDSRRDYWEPKIRRNVERDRASTSELRRHGYEVWRVWECDLKTISALERTAEHLERQLSHRISEIRAK